MIDPYYLFLGWLKRCLVQCLDFKGNRQTCQNNDWLRQICQKQGSGCGSVDRAVASDTRDRQFESCDWQNFTYQIFYQINNRKDENKEEEAGNSLSFEKNFVKNINQLQIEW